MQSLCGHDGERAVEVVNAVDEVFGEALKGEVFGGLDFALCALLKVAEVGYGAEVLVLQHECQSPFAVYTIRTSGR